MAGIAPPTPGTSWEGPGDEDDPENIALLAVWLCTDGAAGVSGHVIGTSGWTMSLYSPRRVNRAVSKRSRWTLDELDQLLPSALTEGLLNPAPAAVPTPSGEGDGRN